MDETLIHTIKEHENIKKSDITLNMDVPTGGVFTAKINIRPFIMESLRILKNLNCEIIVFTASEQYYCDAVLDYLDPNRDLIDYIFYRESCIQTKHGFYLKDLRIFKNRNIKDVVLIDNSPYSYLTNLENAIPIIPFYFNKNDREMKDLVKFIKK